MRNHRPPSEPARFESNLRHYHRTGAPAQRTWDEWVDGSKVKPRSSRKWLKILGIVVGLLALCGIIVGLIVEMG